MHIGLAEVLLVIFEDGTHISLKTGQRANAPWCWLALSLKIEAVTSWGLKDDTSELKHQTPKILDTISVAWRKLLPLHISEYGRGECRPPA